MVPDKILSQYSRFVDFATIHSQSLHKNNCCVHFSLDINVERWTRGRGIYGWTKLATPHAGKAQLVMFVSAPKRMGQTSNEPFGFRDIHLVSGKTHCIGFPSSPHDKYPLRDSRSQGQRGVPPVPGVVDGLLRLNRPPAPPPFWGGVEQKRDDFGVQGWLRGKALLGPQDQVPAMMAQSGQGWALCQRGTLFFWA